MRMKYVASDTSLKSPRTRNNLAALDTYVNIHNSTTQHPAKADRVKTWKALLDLLSLELNSLIINKDALSLIRLRHAPLPNASRKMRHNFLINALQQDPRRLRRTCLDTTRNSQIARSDSSAKCGARRARTSSTTSRA